MNVIQSLLEIILDLLEIYGFFFYFLYNLTDILL